ncbi:MAG: BolA family transcriptional regulator [Rubrivivax sp.]|nr:BolA family transcriptional regulator [Rubrivivax sp.]
MVASTRRPCRQDGRQGGRVPVLHSTGGHQAGSLRVAVNAADIDARLRAALDPLRLEVQDDSARHAGHAGAREGGHFTVRITSARFAGLTRVARHRLVYDALGPLAPQRVHALAIEARAPDEWPDGG